MIFLTGVLVRKPFTIGQRTDRDAIVLEVDTKDYLIKYEPHNFTENEIYNLEGKVITCRGTLKNSCVFHMTEFTTED
jgi:hypothetical protein